MVLLDCIWYLQDSEVVHTRTVLKCVHNIPITEPCKECESKRPGTKEIEVVIDVIEPYLIQYAEDRIQRVKEEQQRLMLSLPPKKREFVRQRCLGRIFELKKMIREVKRGKL